MIAKLSLVALAVWTVLIGSAAADFHVLPDPDNPPTRGVYACKILDDAGLNRSGELQKGSLLPCTPADSVLPRALSRILR